jgi:hypothetical protein
MPGRTALRVIRPFFHTERLMHINLHIHSDELSQLNGIATVSFPKYTSQLVNWANQNAQGTRPRIVGQMSELFQQFQQETEDITVQAWEEWYSARKPDALENATERIYQQVRNLQEAITHIDRDLVARWVHDLVVHKTFTGLYVQRAILAVLARRSQSTYRLATPEEEAQGIDGFVGDRPYSIKPLSYRDTMKRLPEQIGVTIVFYDKQKDGLRLEFEE